MNVEHRILLIEAQLDKTMSRVEKYTGRAIWRPVESREKEADEHASGMGLWPPANSDKEVKQDIVPKVHIDSAEPTKVETVQVDPVKRGRPKKSDGV